MKKLLVFILVLAGSLAATAQSTENNLGKNYWGIRQGFSPVSYFRSNDYLLTLPKNMNMQLDFVYGLRLNRSFYFETGLTYYHTNHTLGTFYSGNPAVKGEFNTYSSHNYIIPIGIRYRTTGEQWRFTANAFAQTFGAGFSRSQLRGYNQNGEQIESSTKLDRGLGWLLNYQLGLGLEYQLSTQWLVRAEVNTSISGLKNLPQFSIQPSYHLGIFKTISPGKKF
jgi:opacity protein-like surface antigen